ncbi:conserved hypothetical protein [Neospora caninum Liverpool]|uniref:WD domain, G-beta repeat-containing protein n=1 Tax=Neospora caninum (strain Liverpool) TaxID=572307 RepID=F0VG89_NEOCL|nr:conserved hypothetical protein [Neospora caninum Liverpool]CBZ52733.1 conserved hypothetical protein [Neospora caninum Liverpool]CEL66714.1 TPA: WD domain, G-beta repeat-containing protein [Neospora caninum Liverpool]|eukprot:XP_003882765.1 conserved hypothetical protein [Neospora caninum Liverpool]
MPWRKSKPSLAASESPDSLRRAFWPSRPLPASASPSLRSAFPAQSFSDEERSPFCGAKSEATARGALSRPALASPGSPLLSDGLDTCARHGLVRSKGSSRAQYRAASTPLRPLRRPEGALAVQKSQDPADRARLSLGERRDAEKTTCSTQSSSRWSALDVLLSEDVLRYVLSYCGPREAASLAAVSPVCRGALSVAALEPLWYAWWVDRQFHFWPHTQVPPDVLPCSQPFREGSRGRDPGGGSPRHADAAPETGSRRWQEADSATPSVREKAPHLSALSDSALPSLREAHGASSHLASPRCDGPVGAQELYAEGDRRRGLSREDSFHDTLGRKPDASPFITGALDIDGCPPTTPPLIRGVGPHSGVWRRQFLWSVRTLHNWAIGRCQRFQVPSSDHSLLSVALHPSYQSPLCSCHAAQSIFSAEFQRRLSRHSSVVTERRVSRAGSTAREVPRLTTETCDRGESARLSPEMRPERSPGASFSTLPSSVAATGEEGREEAWGDAGRAELDEAFPFSPGFDFKARFFSVHDGLDAVLEQGTCFFTASTDRVAVYEHVPASPTACATRSSRTPHADRLFKEPKGKTERQCRSLVPSPALGPRSHPDVHSKLLSSPALTATAVVAPVSRTREPTISDLDSYEIYLWNQTGCAPNNVKNRTSGGGALGGREALDVSAARASASAFEGGLLQAIGLGAVNAGSQGGAGNGGRRGKAKSKKTGSGRKSGPGFPESPTLSPMDAAHDRLRSCGSPPPFSLEPALNPVLYREGREGDRPERRKSSLAGNGDFKNAACSQARETGSRERIWKDFASPLCDPTSNRAIPGASEKPKERGRSVPTTPASMQPLRTSSRPPVHDLSRFRGGASLLSCRIHTETGRMACTIGTAGVAETPRESRLGGRRRRKCGGSVGGAGTGNSTICEGRMYDLHSGQLVCSLDIDGNGLHHLQFRYAFSDDAGLLFGFDRWHREFVCWNLASLCEGQSRLDAAAVIAAHADGILAMDVAGCGPGRNSSGDCRVLAGSRDDTISLYATDPFVRLQTFTGHEGEVSAVCWLARTPCNEEAACGCLCSRRQPAGVFASGAYDALVKIWDVRQKSSVAAHRDRQLTLLEHHSRISSIAAAGSDQRMLVTGDTDGVVKLWDLRRCTKSVCTVQYDGPVTELHANAAFCLVCVSSRRGKDGLYVMDFSGDVPV